MRLKSAVAAMVMSIMLLVSVGGALQVDRPLAENSQRDEARPIVFMTDFGIANDAVAICKGVIFGIAPQARIFDITHLVTPFAIAEGARFLAETAPYYPANAVFLVVVDPGVGSTRKPVVVRNKRGQYFVLPDNGLITIVAGREGITEAREISNAKWMIGAGISSTFHGRDIFSPVAAHLARGEDWTQVGGKFAPDDLVRLSLPVAVLDVHGLRGVIIGFDDPYGNLITNATGDDLAKRGYHLGDTVLVEVEGQHFSLPFVRTFSDVPSGKPLLYIDSRRRLSLAINLGDFAKTHGIEIFSKFLIPAKPRP